MTYCLGIKVKSGIIGISDTRITSGHETTQAKKVFTINKEKHSFFYNDFRITICKRIRPSLISRKLLKKMMKTIINYIKL